MYKLFFITIALFGLSPFTVVASEIRLETSKVEVGTGDQFVVSLMMSADEPVNALEGQLLFPGDTFLIKEIRDGNSSVNFWITKPQSKSPGAIDFSGITPGGFSGVNNHLFSVVFEAKHEGAAVIRVGNMKALRNDGSGTPESLKFVNTEVVVKKGDSSVNKESLKDTVAPEPFTPTITHSQDLFENKLFVAFSTQDKISGIANYEIKEYRLESLSLFSPWKMVNSPYILSDQKLKSHILIRATDNEGNIRVAEITPAHPLSWYEYIFYWIIIVGVWFGVLFGVYTLWKRKNTQTS